jgi:ABC-type polysaccharide/polyol phosphate export permease
MPTDVQTALAFNPLVHVIGALRHAIYPVYHVRHDILLFPALVGLGLVLVGLLLMRRNRARLTAP